jgi:hypothetical protein
VSGEHPNLPEEARAFVARVSGQMGWRRWMAEEVRQELEAHFWDALEDIDDPEARVEEVRKITKDFGDPEVLAELMRRGKMRCRTKDPSRLLGLGMAAGVVALALLLGGHFVIFVNIPSALICFGFVFGVGLCTYGARFVGHALWSGRALLWEVDPESIWVADAKVLAGMVPLGYWAALGGFLIGFVYMVANLNDISRIGSGMAVGLLCPLYGLFCAEGIFRPAAQRVAALRHIAALEQTKSNVKKEEAVS